MKDNDDLLIEDELLIDTSEVDELQSMMDDLISDEVKEMNRQLNELYEPIDMSSVLGATARLSDSLKTIEKQYDMSSVLGATARLSDSLSTMKQYDMSSVLGATARLSDSLKTIEKQYDMSSVLGVVDTFSNNLKDTAKAFQENRYALALSSIGIASNNAALEPSNDYPVEQYDIDELLESLFELYINLIASMEKVWNVITTDTAMKIYTIVGFIIGVISLVLAIKAHNAGKFKQTQAIQINNYSNNVEVEIESDRNQVEISIKDK